MGVSVIIVVGRIRIVYTTGQEVDGIIATSGDIVTITIYTYHI